MCEMKLWEEVESGGGAWNRADVVVVGGGCRRMKDGRRLGKKWKRL